MKGVGHKSISNIRYSSKHNLEQMHSIQSYNQMSHIDLIYQNIKFGSSELDQAKYSFEMT